MFFNFNKLFRFEETEGGCILTNYAQNDYYDLAGDKKDWIMTEINIPAKYKGKTVVEIGKDAFRSAWRLQKVTIPEGIRRIGESAFQNCSHLRSVSFPASLEELGSWSFNICEELCEVEFKSYPSFGRFVFGKGLKLPAELFLASLVCSRDITRPINDYMLHNEIYLLNDSQTHASWLLRRLDVFALAAKNNCFRNVGARELFPLFELLIERGCAEHLSIAEEYGMLNAALLDEFTEYSVRQGKPEVTAYLLDLKKRKFGFASEDRYEL